MTHEITWTNCADKMPPDDLDIIIDTWKGEENGKRKNSSYISKTVGLHSKRGND
ncbi:MAG: hypothetical protein IPP99_05925 [Chitinophagaceae bacterium]|nr:hypothetical protein [Chitinophagaceae bacterium]